jgi:hypothetical protein
VMRHVLPAMLFDCRPRNVTGAVGIIIFKLLLASERRLDLALWASETLYGQRNMHLAPKDLLGTSISGIGADVRSVSPKVLRPQFPRCGIFEHEYFPAR